VIESLPDVTPGQVERLRQRCVCAWNWISEFSPEEFRWVLRGKDDPLMDLDENQAKAIGELHGAVQHLDDFDEKQLSEEIYAIAKRCDIAAPELFKTSYGVLIGKERGPKLAGFIKTCGKEKVLPILERYL
jgi:lysyl-tRNA synthetase class 1